MKKTFGILGLLLVHLWAMPMNVAMPVHPSRTQSPSTFIMMAALGLPIACGLGSSAYLEYKNRNRQKEHIQLVTTRVLGNNDRLISEETKWEDKPGHPGAVKLFERHEVNFVNSTFFALSAGVIGLCGLSRWYYGK